MSGRDLWVCKVCGRAFANTCQSHACGSYDLEEHFRGKPQEIRDLYDQFLEELRAIGPVQVLPQKTRIAFQARISFAQLTPKANWIDGHFVLAERREGSPVRRVQTLSPRNHVHEFRLTNLRDFTSELRTLMRAAYEVGEQRHLRRS